MDDRHRSVHCGSGNNLTLNLVLQFDSSWTGTKNNYLFTRDRGNDVAG